MYVYRSLRANEFYNNMIYCKEYYAHSPLVELPKYCQFFGEDALDLVGAHLTKGNNNVTPWISCTKSYDRVKHYLYDKNEYVYGLAIIKNHDKEVIISRPFFSLLKQIENQDITYEQFVNRVRRLYLNDIKKCVLDFSTGESNLFDHFIESGLVRFGDGRIRTFITRWEYNYSQSNDEIVVLGSINNQDAFILDPLKIDILEYLKNNKMIDGISDEFLNNLIESLKIRHYMLADSEVSVEEMLIEPLKSVYLKMPTMMQEVFESLYVYKMTKVSFMKKYSVSKEWLDDIVNGIITRIILSTDYLSELTHQVRKPQKQIVLVNS